MVLVCFNSFVARTAPSYIGGIGHDSFNVPSYLDIACGMADHIATRKSTFTSASTSRKRRTHQPSVQDFGRRVDVYSKPEKSVLMAKQKQAEECVLYVRVSTTRQAEDGVSIDVQIAKEKLTQNFVIYCFLMRIFSSMTE